MRLHLFGSPAIVTDTEQGETHVSLNKPSWLLFYLAFRRTWVSREELAFFFRPEADEMTARRYVRKLLNGARSLPWAEGLEADGDRLRWLVNTDVDRFQRAAHEGRWFEATQLYRGPFLAGLNTSMSPSYDDWLSLERETLETLWKDASLSYAADLESSGQHHKAAAVAKGVLSSDALAENALQSFLRNAYLDGQREVALETAENFCQTLARDLSLKPLQETSDLIETVRLAKPLRRREVARTYGRRSTDRAFPPSVEEAQLESLIDLLASADARLLTVAGDGDNKDALLIAKRVPKTEVALYAVAALAERLARDGHVSRAAELLVLVLHHPACDARARYKAATLWQRLEPTLPEDLAESARARWQQDVSAPRAA